SSTASKRERVDSAPLDLLRSAQRHASTAAPLLRIAATSPTAARDRDTKESLSDRARSRVSTNAPPRHSRHADSRCNRDSQSHPDYLVGTSTPVETQSLPGHTAPQRAPHNRAGNRGSRCSDNVPALS